MSCTEEIRMLEIKESIARFEQKMHMWQGGKAPLLSAKAELEYSMKHLNKLIEETENEVKTCIK